MADVFISYQSDDRAFAQTLAQRLGEHGFTIWHDQGLRADGDYYKQIAAELAAARVVVALWSARSDNSRWVYSEADEADKANKLINATIDGRIPPKPFDRLHCRDLRGWQGATSDDRFRSLLEDLRSVISRPDGGVVAERSLPPDSAAARAWVLIQDETDPQRYHQFLEVHGASPQATMARRHLDDIARWRALAGPPSRQKLAEIDQFILSGPFSALGEGAKSWRQQTLQSVSHEEALAVGRQRRQNQELAGQFYREQRQLYEDMPVFKALMRAKNNAERFRQELDEAQEKFDDVKDAKLVQFAFGLPPSWLVWAGRWLMWTLVLWPVAAGVGVLGFLERLSDLQPPEVAAVYAGWAGFPLSIAATISVDFHAFLHDSRLRGAEEAQSAATRADAALKNAQAAADEAWKQYEREIDEHKSKQPGA